VRNKSRCAGAYIMSRKGAIKLFKSSPIRYPADWQMTRAGEEGLAMKFYWLEPAMLKQARYETLPRTGIRPYSTKRTKLYHIRKERKNIPPIRKFDLSANDRFKRENVKIPWDRQRHAEFYDRNGLH